jgi:hypothetical protein
MRAVLRRSNGPRHPRLTVRDLEIDLASRVVTVGGMPVQLSAMEYELLVALAEDPERVFKKEELLRNVWGFRSLGRAHRSYPIRRPPHNAAQASWAAARLSHRGIEHRRQSWACRDFEPSDGLEPSTPLLTMEAAASSYAMPRRRLVRRFPCNSPLSSRAGPSPRGTLSGPETPEPVPKT